MEERHRIFADRLVGRDDVQVGILFGGGFVVIARAEMGNIADVFPLLEDDGDDFGMHLVIFHPVDDGAARLLQFARVMQVALLVETRHQLDDDGNLLAPLARLAQRIDDARMIRQAVDRDFDRLYPLILGAFVQKIQDGRHAVVRVRKKNIFGERIIDQRIRAFQFGRNRALERRIFQRICLFDGQKFADRK